MLNLARSLRPRVGGKSAIIPLAIAKAVWVFSFLLILALTLSLSSSLTWTWTCVDFYQRNKKLSYQFFLFFSSVFLFCIFVSSFAFWGHSFCLQCDVVDVFQSVLAVISSVFPNTAGDFAECVYLGTCDEFEFDGSTEPTGFPFVCHPTNYAIPSSIVQSIWSIL